METDGTLIQLLRVACLEKASPVANEFVKRFVANRHDGRTFDERRSFSVQIVDDRKGDRFARHVIGALTTSTGESTERLALDVKIVPYTHDYSSSKQQTFLPIVFDVAKETTVDGKDTFDVRLQKAVCYVERVVATMIADNAFDIRQFHEKDDHSSTQEDRNLHSHMIMHEDATDFPLQQLIQIRCCVRLVQGPGGNFERLLFETLLTALKVIKLPTIFIDSLTGICEVNWDVTEPMIISRPWQSAMIHRSIAIRSDNGVLVAVDPNAKEIAGCDSFATLCRYDDTSYTCLHYTTANGRLNETEAAKFIAECIKRAKKV